ncbi:Spo0J and IME4 domain-containing protein [Magnetococcus sp. PR-3]|uniref:Spo0J and IME4 domain-containing protein n=1 Tax=Magnetococcus sp. PR-3 TaxID=3120355 RepID=UPI002FCDE40B
MKTYDFHPIADIFPLMSEQELNELTQDIRDHGQREPIWLHTDGRILDGRNRYNACCAIGAEPFVEIYQGDDPVAFSISLNLHRRHLNESQRAMVAARLKPMFEEEARARMLQGGASDPMANLPQGKVGASREHAAELTNVSARSVENASCVLRQGTPDLIDKVETGKVSVSTAADLSNLPQEAQQAVVAKGEEAILDAAKEIRARKAKENAAQRAQVRADALKMDLPDGKYRTIIIDPPWPMQKVERDQRLDQVGFDYPTMSEVELADLDVGGLAHEECHLFLWTTQKFLPMAMRLMEKWGFPYIFQMVWHKPGGFQPFGLPQYNCEFVLFGRKGRLEFLETKSFSTCFNAPRREHSRKPNEFYDLIRRVSPSPRIDLFSREQREGFDTWGAESGKFGEVA